MKRRLMCMHLLEANGAKGSETFYRQYSCISMTK